MDLRSIVVGGILLLASAAHATAPLPPDGQVVDLAGVLDTPSALQLGGALSSYVAVTGLDLTVVTVAKLHGEALPDYAQRVLQARSANNPLVALLIWAPPQQLAIAVSAAYTHHLSVDEIRQVLDDYALPGLREGRTADALLQSIFALMVAAGEPGGTATADAPIILFVDATPVTGTRPPEPESLAVELPGRDAAAELATLRRGLADTPATTLSTIWTTAGTQTRALLAALQATGAALDAHFSGGPQMPPDRLVFALGGLVASLIVLVSVVRMGLRRGNPGMALSVAGLAAATACWLLAGYLELALLLAVAGPLSWALLRLLPMLLARADQERLPASVAVPGLASQPRPAIGKPAAPSRREVAAAPVPTAKTRPPHGWQKPSAPADRPSGKPQDGAHKKPHDLASAIERAHRDGIRTPALDHLFAQKGKRPLAQRQKQRQYWLIALFVCFFVAFPLVFVLLMAWAASELNQVKPSQQKLSDFVRQLVAELRAVSQHQRPQA